MSVLAEATVKPVYIGTAIRSAHPGGASTSYILCMQPMPVGNSVRSNSEPTNFHKLHIMFSIFRLTSFGSSMPRLKRDELLG